MPPHRLRSVRPPLSGAVKVSRFGFTEGSGWFELLALRQLCSEARDRSLSPPPTLLEEWGGSQRPLLATRALRKASDGGRRLGGGFPGPQRPSGADTHGWEFTGTHSSSRRQGCVSQAAFSLTLFLRDPLGPCLLICPWACRGDGAWRRRAFQQKGLRSSLRAQLFPPWPRLREKGRAEAAEFLLGALAHGGRRTMPTCRA